MSSTISLRQQSTTTLKQQLIELAQPCESEPLPQKIKFYKSTLAPLFEELAQRNPTPDLHDQGKLVVGCWLPVWSTNPFQDVLPGRRLDQSYQIFRADGHYANIARYAPGTDWPLLRRLPFDPVVYDLLLIQRYQVESDEWQIENVGIKQGLHLGPSPLTAQAADNWFSRTMAKTANQPDNPTLTVKVPFSKKTNQKASKQLQGANKAKPKLEHLYIDDDFRLVKSKREEKQRPSYTIAVKSDLGQS
jgi:hypothetical protein